MKSSMLSLKVKLQASKTNSLKKPHRDAKRVITGKEDYSRLRAIARSYSEYRPSDYLFQLCRLNKDQVSNYKSHFGNVNPDHAKDVVPVESAFGLLYQICLKLVEMGNIFSINNQLLKTCLPNNVTGINNNLICYFLEAMGRASDLSLSSRQIVIGSQVYQAIKNAGGFGISQFVLSPDRQGIPIDPKVKKVTEALKFDGDLDKLTKDIDNILVSYGHESIQDLSQKEYNQIQRRINQSTTTFDLSEVSEQFRNKYSAVQLSREFDKEEESDNNEEKNSEEENQENQDPSANTDRSGGDNREESSDGNNPPNQQDCSDNPPPDSGDRDNSSEHNTPNDDSSPPEESDNQQDEVSLLKSQLSLSKNKMLKVMLGILPINFDKLDPESSERKDCYVLVYHCILTKFTLFEDISIPTELNGISFILNRICGIFGPPHSVDYYRSGVCFNQERYQSHSESHNIVMDHSSPYGDYPAEMMEKQIFLGELHTKLFANSGHSCFRDSRNTTVLCNLDPSEELIRGYESKVTNFLCVFKRNCTDDNAGSPSPSWKHVPTSQHEVNCEDKTLFGPHSKLPEKQVVAKIRGKSSYEKMFGHSYSVQQTKNERHLLISNHYTFDDCIHDDGFKEYNSETDLTVDEDRIVSDLINRSSLKTFGLPPSKVPLNFGPEKVFLMYEGNKVQDTSGPSTIVELFDTTNPVGFQNNGTFCFLNAVVRFLLESQAFLQMLQEYLDRVAKRVRQKAWEDLETSMGRTYLIASFLCTTSLLGNYAKKRIPKHEKVFDLKLIRNALLTKCFDLDSDAFQVEGNCDSVEILRFILTAISKEFVTSDKGFFWKNQEAFDKLFCNSTRTFCHCKTHDDHWYLDAKWFEDDYIRRLTLGPLKDKSIKVNSRFDMEGREEIIHLQDLIDKENRNWDEVCEDLRCHKVSNGIFWNMHGSQSLSSLCECTKRRVYNEESEVVLFEIVRTYMDNKQQREVFVDSKQQEGVVVPFVLLLDTTQNRFYHTFETAIVHEGSKLNCGHYVVYKQHFNGTCLRISDATVTEVSKEVFCKEINMKGVILLYKRCEKPSALHLQRGDARRQREDNVWDDKSAHHYAVRPEHWNEPRTTLYNYDVGKTENALDVSFLEPHLLRKLKDCEETLQEKRAKKRKLSLRSSSSSANNKQQTTLTQHMNSNLFDNSDEEHVPKKSKSANDVICIEDDDDSCCSSLGNTDGLGSSGDSDELANFDLFDIENEVKDGEVVQLLTAHGLQKYKCVIEDNDDSTPGLQQNCIYCNEKTDQKIGKVTSVCMRCKNGIGSPLLTLATDGGHYKSLQRLQRPLNKTCFNCFCSLDSQGDGRYHNAGALKWCFTCQNDGKCKCVTCIYSNGNANRIVEIGKTIANELKDRTLDFETKYITFVRHKNELKAKLKNASSSKTTDEDRKELRSFEKKVHYYGHPGRFIHRPHSGYTKTEVTLLNEIKACNSPFIQQFGLSFLSRKDALELLNPISQKVVKKNGSNTPVTPLSEEFIMYYLTFLKSTVKKRNPNTKVHLLLREEEVLLRIINLAKQNDTKKHVFFVWRSIDEEPSKRTGVYFFESDLQISAQLTYFDPKIKIDKFDTSLKKLWHDLDVPGKKRLHIESNYNVNFGKLKFDRTFNSANNSVYSLMFLLNCLCYNNAKKMIQFGDRHIDQCKVLLCMSCIVNDPYYF